MKYATGVRNAPITRLGHYFRIAVVALVGFGLWIHAGIAIASQSHSGVSILAYHRFGPTVADSMTVTTPVLEQQLAWLTQHDCRILPLRTFVDGLRKNERSGVSCAVVITVDDGHRTVYTELFPLVRKYGFPITLFIYPSAISNASYAMTWEQIAEMAGTGLVDIQSHTYWHPNFRTEKARLSPGDYDAFVRTQLLRSQKVLAEHSRGAVDMLAWPFGIYDAALERAAQDAGYVAAFSIERRSACSDDDILALPRYLMNDLDRGARFAAIVGGSCR